MRVLFHFALSPFCRKVRLAMAEKQLSVRAESVLPWAAKEALLDLHPAGTVPVLIDEDESVIPDSTVIVEYLEDRIPQPSLLPGDPKERAEARRLALWFDLKFHREVTELLLYERVHKRLGRAGHPDTARIRAGTANLRIHLDYLGYLTEHRHWLAGRGLSVADLAAAAHLSCLDYLDCVPWSDFPAAKDWYQRIKSRPPFRPLLEDRIPGMTPPPHYSELDF